MKNSVQLDIEAESSEGNVLPDDVFQEILHATDRSLVLPAQKRSPQLLLCPVGLVGAGKSTVVRPLSERLGLVRISTDEIRERLKARGYNYLRTQDIAKQLINKYIAAGQSVAIDADCAGSAQEIIAKLTQNTAIQPVWIHINPPESFILNKLRTYKHTWLFKDADEAISNYMRRKPLHEHLDMPFLYTFDTSKTNLPLQIDEAVTLIERL